MPMVAVLASLATFPVQGLLAAIEVPVYNWPFVLVTWLVVGIRRMAAHATLRGNTSSVKGGSSGAGVPGERRVPEQGAAVKIVPSSPASEADMADFDDLFQVATSSDRPSTAAGIAAYWAMRRGKGPPTADDIAHEQVWERIVHAQERGEALLGEVRERAANGWKVAIDSVTGWLPDEWISAAGVPVAVGRIEILVLRYDRVTEELVVRLRLPGE